MCEVTSGVGSDSLDAGRIWLMTRAVKLRDDYSAADLRRLAARSRLRERCAPASGLGGDS